MAQLEQLENIDLSYLSENEAKEYLLLLEELQKRNQRDAATSNFLTFVKTLWDTFIEGEHHKKMAKVFDDIAEGKTKRVIVNMAPRHTKSEFASHYFPAYLLGKKLGDLPRKGIWFRRNSVTFHSVWCNPYNPLEQSIDPPS